MDQVRQTCAAHGHGRHGEELARERELKRHSENAMTCRLRQR
jgi:hypothetical protein